MLESTSRIPQSRLSGAAALSPAQALMLLLALTLALWACPAPVLGADPAAVEGEVIVRFKPGVKLVDIESRLKSLDLTLGSVLVEPSESRGQYIVLVRSERLSAPAMAERLAPDPLVDVVTLNSRRKGRAVPNDPGFSSQWGLRNTGQAVGTSVGTPGEDVKATSAWDVTTGDTSVVVVVADSGVKYDHPDLSPNMWVNPNPHSDGTYDGTYGANFAADNSGATSDDPMDTDGHGTHCAGIIGAATNNAAGVAGMAWGTKLMAVKLQRPNGEFADSGVLSGISYILKKKRRGVNIVAVSASFGGPGRNPLVLDQIAELGRAGIIWVGAAGNDALNNDVSPIRELVSSADLPNIISVAATNSTGGLAAFSCFGRRTVDLGAPGVNIYSTYIDGALSIYKVQNGTSMATPFVSGAVALLAAKYPSDTVWTRIRRVLSTVDPLPSLSGKTLTGGRLNAYAALAASPTLMPLVVNASTQQGLTAGTSLTLNGFGFGGSSGRLAFEDSPGTETAGSLSSWGDEAVTGTVPSRAGRFVRVKTAGGSGSNFLEVTAWSPRATSSVARQAPASAVYGGRFHLFGGQSSAGTALASAESFDPQANAWSTLAAPPSARAFSASVVSGSVAYLFGGSSGATRLSTVDSYDFSTGTWSTCTPVGLARNATAAGVVSGTILVAGGDTATGTVSAAITSYAPSTCTATTLATPLNTARHRHTAVGVGDSLYVFGGTDGAGVPISNLEVYNATAGTATARAMPFNMTDAWAVAVNQDIYIATGFRWNGTQPTSQTFLYSYRPSTNTWTNQSGTINEPLRQRCWACLGYVPGRGLMSGAGLEGGSQTVLNTLDFLQMSPTMTASAIQPVAGQTAVVLGQAAQYQSEAELASTYGFPASSWEKYTDPLAFNASVSLTGNLAAFEYSFTSSRRIAASGLSLFKLDDNAHSTRRFTYAANATDWGDGRWWLGNLDGTYLAPASVLAANGTYMVHLCLKDNGLFDLDSTLGLIRDPLVLAAPKSQDSSHGGCVLNPGAGLGWEWGLVLAGIGVWGMVRLVWRRGDGA
jgi:subtilisin family serine protease